MPTRSGTVYATPSLSHPLAIHTPATMPMSTKDFIATFPATEFYSGQASPRALDGYIFRVTRLLKEANDNTPDSCLDLAITALSGAAQEWIRGTHPVIAATAIPHGSPNTFLVGVLFEQLRRRFLPSNGALIAKTTFLDTKQTGAFEEYASSFETASTAATEVGEPPLSQAWLVCLFIRGLRDSPARMHVTAANPRDLVTAISLARVYVSGTHARPAAAVAAVVARPPRSFPPRTSSAQVTRARAEDQVSDSLSEERFRKGLCLSCGSPDHIRRDCPTRLARRSARSGNPRAPAIVQDALV